MGAEINLRLYQVGDEAEIVELLKNSFPNWSLKQDPIDYWKWKYVESPHKSVIRIALINDKIVGVGHNIILDIKINDSIYKSWYGDDYATHQDYRGMGVFSKLQTLTDKLIEVNGIKFAFSVSTNPIIIKYNDKIGRVMFPHPISQLARIQDINLHLKNKTTENRTANLVGFRLLKSLNKLATVFTPRQNQVQDFRIEEIKSFDGRVDAFWENVNTHYSFIIEKDKGYLNWRYCDPRGGAYRVMQAVRGGEILGFIVTELKTGSYPEGYVMDLLAQPKRLDVANALLEEACSYFDGLGVNAVHYLEVKGHPYERLSNKLGFINTSRSSNMHIISDFRGIEKEYEALKSSPPSRAYYNSGTYL